MSFGALDGLGGLLLCGLPFLFVQRWLHREIQAVLLLLTRRPAVAIGLFSLLFFPGILLHEASHYLVARLLGVKTGRFSLLPHLLTDGRLRLGYVEMVATDPIREAFIGTAPLLTGGAAIVYLGIYHLGLMPLATAIQQGDWGLLAQMLPALPGQSDFWLWFYLAFAVSSTMLPSDSDRRAWLPLTLGLLLISGLALLAGAGPWMWQHLLPWVNGALRILALVFGISLALHLVLLIPTGLLAALLERLTGLQVA